MRHAGVPGGRRGVGETRGGRGRGRRGGGGTPSGEARVRGLAVCRLRGAGGTRRRRGRRTGRGPGRQLRVAREPEGPRRAGRGVRALRGIAGGAGPLWRTGTRHPARPLGVTARTPARLRRGTGRRRTLGVTARAWCSGGRRTGLATWCRGAAEEEPDGGVMASPAEGCCAGRGERGVGTSPVADGSAGRDAVEGSVRWGAGGCGAAVEGTSSGQGSDQGSPPTGGSAGRGRHVAPEGRCFGRGGTASPRAGDCAGRGGVAGRGGTVAPPAGGVSGRCGVAGRDGGVAVPSGDPAPRGTLPVWVAVPGGVGWPGVARWRRGALPCSCTPVSSYPGNRPGPESTGPLTCTERTTSATHPHGHAYPYRRSVIPGTTRPDKVVPPCVRVTLRVDVGREGTSPGARGICPEHPPTLR